MNPFGDALYGSGTDLIKSELGAYRERLLGSGSVYVQGNISRYFSNPQYYFQVNDQYVMNKLKLILFPFLHKGHWMRATETVGGEFSYKPPIHDINAPDLFSAEALGVQATNGVLCWLFQVLLLEATLHTLGDGDVPFLDICSFNYSTFQDCLELLFLCCYIVGMFVYGNVACEDHEENFDCGGEKV
ncbi:hypothetical protein CRYUN_Cryun26dG0014700 [Craigia yunnanensis]